MTTATASILANASTEAALRTLGQAVSDLMTAAGLTKTSDTGQISWAGVTKASGAGTLYGYEIRTVPTTIGTLLARFEYYSASTSGSGLSLKFQVGTGSNGSGTLTGTFGAALSTVVTTNAMNDTSSMPCFAATWDGGFAVSLWPGHGTRGYRQLLIMDRTCDENGTMDSAGLIFGATSLGSYMTPLMYGYSASLGVRAQFPSFPARIPYLSGALVASAVWDGKRPFAVVRHLTPAPRWHKNILVGWQADCGLGAVMDVTVFGASRRYISMGAGFDAINGLTPDTGSTEGALCFRWE